MSDFAVKRDTTNPPINIFTHSLAVRNAGRKVATNVRLRHAFLPDFRVTPTVEFHVRDVNSNLAELVFPRLLPGGHITVADYLHITSSL